MAAAKELVLVEIQTIGNLKAMANAYQNLELLHKQGYNTTHAMEVLSQKAIRMGYDIRDLNKAFGRFRMELLSVMFFGWQMSAVFGSMLKPAEDMMGATESWATVLGLTFLPAAEQQLKWAWGTYDALEKLNTVTGGASSGLLNIGVTAGEQVGNLMTFAGQAGLLVLSLEKMGSKDLVMNLGTLGVQLGLIAAAGVGIMLLASAFSEIVGSIPAVQEYEKDQEKRRRKLITGTDRATVVDTILPTEEELAKRVADYNNVKILDFESKVGRMINGKWVPGIPDLTSLPKYPTKEEVLATPSLVNNIEIKLTYNPATGSFESNVGGNSNTRVNVTDEVNRFYK